MKVICRYSISTYMEPIGAIFGVDNFTAMADYLAELEEAAKPFHLRIEGPMDAEEREKQMHFA